MSILAEATALQAYFRTNVSTSVAPTVSMHPGPLDIQEVKRYAIKSPAIVIAPIGGGSGNDEYVAGSIGIVANFGIYLLATGKSRAETCISLLDVCLPLAMTYGGVRKTSFDNLFSAGQDDKGVAMWAIEISKMVEIQHPLTPAEFDEFNLCANAWALGGVAGPFDPETGEMPENADALPDVFDV